MLPFVVIHAPAGGRAFEATPILDSIRYDTAAVGGYGSLEVSLQGDVRKRFGYLGITRLVLGSTVVWEGQLEDTTLSVSGGQITTTIRCFGLKRLLEETGVRRIWSKRDHNWVPGIFLNGQTDGGITRVNNAISMQAGAVTTGAYGVTGAGNSVAMTVNQGNWLDYYLPSGLFGTYLLWDMILSGPNTGAGKMFAYWQALDSNGSFLSGTSASTGSANQTLPANCAGVRLGAYANGTVTPTPSDIAQFTNIRLLGTSLTEDAAGGFYGGSILRDLVALVPGLSAGIIEDGSDYTIQALERAVRDNALSVVNEVAGYYAREWAVWNDGMFDWKTRNLDEPQWIVGLSLLRELELSGSIDDIARTVYVLYTDAASGLDAEQSSVGTDQHNPYVRQGHTKDVIVQSGFPMTSNTAAQLAGVVASDIAARPFVTGRCVLSATALVSNAVGTPKPAAMIRAGDNIALPELPKSDMLVQGRDGETLFHIVASSVDLTGGTVTLELEGQQSRQSVILARLAQATRTLTG